MDGVLKSWAVPKGPSVVPGEKRLAVHVEDHPLEYGGFEGTIPKGEYGGGSVIVWDRGRWEPEGDAEESYRLGRLKFRLDGEKLRGAWTLVRMGGAAGEHGKNWLLIKKHDDEAAADRDLLAERPESVISGRTVEDVGEGRAATKRRAAKTKRAPEPKLPARRAALPESAGAELATLVTDAPAGDDWLHEVKFDGYRILARVDRGRVRLVSRNGKDWTDRLASVARAVAKLPAKTAWIDGEVVAFGPDGLSSFNLLQNAFGERGVRRPAKGAEPDLVYCVFDLLHLDGADLTREPLERRKEILRSIVPRPRRDRAVGTVRFSDHVGGDGPEFHREACARRLEGIVSKKRLSPYRAGRGTDWLKVRCSLRQELVIGGYTDPGGARAGFGALLVGYHAKGSRRSGKLRYAGRVGTGFGEKLLLDLGRRLAKMTTKAPPFEDPPRERGVHWVEPKLVAEVSFTEWTGDGKLRHPSFEGLREDKRPASVVREMPKETENVARDDAGAAPKKQNKNTGERTVVAGVTITHPDRVLYPGLGVTKEELARYYEAVAPRMLPHVEGHALMIVRCPQGQGSQCFFQKHFEGDPPPGTRVVRLKEAEGTRGAYIVPEAAKGLVALAQIGTLEIHSWGSRADDSDRPERMIFDLDPDPSVAWKDVVAAARSLRARLESVELPSFVKTTGGKGLHVVVPLVPDLSWEEVREFSRALALEFVEREPRKFTATLSKAKRKGRILIDCFRNGRGATAVAAYSTRAKPGAPVSAPIRWDELKPSLRSDHFTVRSILRRIGPRAKDPWAGFEKARASLRDAIGAAAKSPRPSGKSARPR